MENLFTRGEIITFKIIGWVIAAAGIIASVALFFYNGRELKRQEKRTDDLLKKLQEEIVARKDSERKIVENELKKWETLYRQEKEGREKDRKIFEEIINNLRERDNKLSEEKNRLRKEVWDVRKQLFRKGVPWEEHSISDESQRQEAVVDVEMHWEKNQSKNGKINKKTTTDLLGENWWKNFKNKEGKDIVKERDWLIAKINYEINQQSKND